MTATNKLRVATIDTPHAIDIACSVVFSAVGLAVQAELQEIERGSLIIELQLGNESVHTPHPSRLASTVDKAAADVEVLSAWKESACPGPDSSALPRCHGSGLRTLASSCAACP